MAYYVYILKSFKDGTCYVGSTQDLESRIKRYNQGLTKRGSLLLPVQLPGMSTECEC